MGEVSLKIVKAFYPEDMDIRNLLNYIVRDKETYEQIALWSTRGTLRNVDDAYKQMVGLQRFLEKDNERRMYHFIVSFEENVCDVDCVCTIAEDIANYLGKEYQLLYGIHTDTDNYHIHIAMNAISYKDGKKWHKKSKDVDKWIKHFGKLQAFFF